MAIARAEERKRARYPELAVCRRQVLACETGGRWSQDCADLVRHLADSRAREAPEVLRASLRAAWAARWWGLLSVAQQGALAASLGEALVLLPEGFDGEAPPLGDVLLDRAP